MKDKKIRVLMAVPQYPFPVVGGLERQSYELSKQLVQQGAFVCVISGMLAQNKNALEFVDGIEVVRFPWNVSRGFRFTSTWAIIAKTMYKMRNRYDVVHVHNVSWFGAITILISKVLNKVVMAKLPNVGSTGIPGMRKRRLGRLLVWIFKRADAIVAMSLESVKELQQVGYPDARIFKMTNGVSTEEFAPNENIVRDRTIPLIVVFCGRLDRIKGLVDLVSIWPSVLDKASRPCELKIYGGGPLRNELEELIASLDMEGNIFIMGHEDRIAEVLRKADVFVLPSYEEGNSNAILEAMAVGLPIVSTRVGGTRLLVGFEGDPYLVNAGDRTGLQDRLAALLTNEEARLSLGRSMHNRATTYFQMNIVAQRYMLAYNCLLKGERDNVAAISTPVFSE